MSEFNNYAVELNEAFNDAAGQYNKVYADYQAAEKKNKEAESPTEKIKAAAELEAAKAELKKAQREIWPGFQKKRDKLGRDLEAAVNKAQTANPDELDANAVTLLNSGMLKADDLKSLADKYADNSTMQRMIGKKAGEMADEIGDKDPETRQALNLISHNCEQKGKPAALENWDALKNASAHYSGEYQRNPDPGFVSSISEHWTDENVQTLIKDF